MQRKSPITLITLGCLLALAACGGDTELGQGDRAPRFSATTFDGRDVNFPELIDGKPTVVVFWATWCSYCRAFMPELRAIHERYGAERINILTINAKEDGAEDPATYIANLGFPTIAVKDGDAIAADYDVEFIPGLMIVDSDGVVAWRRAWTDLPAGAAIATAWATIVRQNLDQLLAS
jgi:thiol-disulfide isomerase/thioredoxin